MIHFFRLIRPINLVIIALTMYAMRYFYFDLAHLRYRIGGAAWHERLDFALLVFSTVLIAAAGNIINDYFDVKADRINRPERLIISKHIKRRWAIISHWLLNGIAFSIAIYLSIRYHTFWYVFVHLISINALWFYSLYFKRKVLIGNVIVSLLAALVPLLCGIHFHLTAYLDETYYFMSEQQANAHALDWILFLARDGRIIFAMASFAFILNLAREIIKDIQDVAGDEKLFAKTLPMKYGLRGASRIAGSILIVFPLSVIALYFAVREPYLLDLFYFLPLVFILISCLGLGVLLFRQLEEPQFQLIDFTLKILMLLGVLLPFLGLLL
ncbi:MAG: hypothetical protein EP338_02505 [Bacteroidetes bacterium]|nr:MAG: hypothetical protein EP338_02505 [Bacteroidota bacterium]